MLHVAVRSTGPWVNMMRLTGGNEGDLLAHQSQNQQDGADLGAPAGLESIALRPSRQSQLQVQGYVDDGCRVEGVGGGDDSLTENGIVGAH